MHNKTSMLKHGFDMYNVFLSAPGDLERERAKARSVISDVNAEQAMPSKILLVTVGLMSDAHAVLAYSTSTHVTATPIVYSGSFVVIAE